MPAALECVFEKHLQEAVPRLPFDDAVLTSFPGTLTTASVVSEVQTLFRDIPNYQQAPWHRAQKRLAGSNFGLWGLSVLIRHQGISEFTSGPTCGQCNRALLQAAVARQKAAGDSRKGLDHLLPPGLTKEDHMQQAFSIPSPFHCLDTLDPDLMFSCMALGVWGPQLPVWRQRLPVDACSLHCVAGLARRSQPLRYLTGFPAVGHIEHTGIFRDIPDTQEVEEQDFLGQDAIDFVDSLITKPPSPDAATVWSLTVEESTKGWCSGPFSRAQMDVTFQRGMETCAQVSRHSTVWKTTAY